MGFKDAVEADLLGVFLSLEEFAGEHDVDGAVVPCVIDQVERSDRDYESGVASDGARLFARTEDLPRRRHPGEQIAIDGRSYTVAAWRDEAGVTEVDLVRGW